MNTSRSTRIALIAAAVSSLTLAGCAVAPASNGYVYYEPVMVAPPPPRVEVITVAPYPGYVWIGGYWGWNGRAHHWVPGRWEAPRPGHYWEPHRWEPQGKGWRERPGQWAPRGKEWREPPRPRDPHGKDVREPPRPRDPHGKDVR
ncbi:MAG: hypothetical protein C3F19_06610 [Rhodocyclales bacterium]|jgi:hypothetical protein|nr:MAG: hypothetical protein C3F19_06610 [Rhodocyclales bacterium]